MAADALDPAQFAIQRKGGYELCSTIELSKKFLNIRLRIRF
jgi:hypothetical protein